MKMDKPTGTERNRNAKERTESIEIETHAIHTHTRTHTTNDTTKLNMTYSTLWGNKWFSHNFDNALACMQLYEWINRSFKWN